MAKNNKTRFFYALYSDKTRVFDQSEREYYPIYIINSISWTVGSAKHHFSTDAYTKYFSYQCVKRKTILEVLITSYKVENHFAVSSNTERRNKHKGDHVSSLC